MKVHPAAELFPMMTGDAFDEFVEDIRANGQQSPISTLPDGTLLDGRNRLEACRKLGLKPTTTVVDTDSPLEFVISANMHRRHLTSSQRAAIAPTILPMLEKEALERKREGGKRSGETRRGEDSKKSRHLHGRSKASAQAAKLLNTNSMYVSVAKRLDENAPDLLEEVRVGKIKIDEAARTLAERNAERNGATRGQILRKAAVNRANDFLGRITAIEGYCAKVNVDAIRSDERLRRLWVDAAKGAAKSLRRIIGQLEQKDGIR